MTEETEPQYVKRGPGRPRKNPEPKVEAKQEPKATPKMRAQPNWATIEPTSEDTPDKFHIPKDMFPEGMDLLWVRVESFGQPDPHWRAGREKQGWTPVHQEDFDGRFDGMWMKRGDPSEINLYGLVLMARPLEFSIKARQRDKRAAREQVAIKEASWRFGDLPVTLDSKHPSAINTNRINKSYERIEIPEE